MSSLRFAIVPVLALVLAGAPSTAFAEWCPEPDEQWNRATPAHVGMDAAKLQSAIDYGTTQAS